jgi:hypothetical protein
MSPLMKGFAPEGLVPLIGFSQIVCEFSAESQKNTKQKVMERKLHILPRSFWGKK